MAMLEKTCFELQLNFSELKLLSICSANLDVGFSLQCNYATMTFDAVLH
jgi:hypothetical protein